MLEIPRDVINDRTQTYGGPGTTTTLRNGDANAVVVQKSGGSAVAVFATGFTTSASGGKDVLYTAR